MATGGDLSALRKSIINSKGLTNHKGENNCFLNSAVQVLWHLDVFRQNFRLFHEHACVGRSCVFCALKIIFTEFQFSDESSVTLVALRMALASTFQDEQKFQLGMMEDAAECFENLLINMHHHLANGQPEDMCALPHCLTHQKFAVTLVEQIVCKCGATSEPLPTVELVRYVSTSAIISQTNANKEKSFGERLRDAFVSGDLPKSCPAKCGSEGTARRTLMNLPDVVSIGIIWMTDEPTPWTITRFINCLDTKFKLTELFPYIAEEHLAKGITLKLVGIVCYYGLHYSTFFFHSIRKCWISFDDECIKEVGPDWDSVVEKMRKGHYQPLLLLYQNPHASLVSNETAPKATIRLKRLIPNPSLPSRELSGNQKVSSSSGSDENRNNNNAAKPAAVVDRLGPNMAPSALVNGNAGKSYIHGLKTAGNHNSQSPVVTSTASFSPGTQFPAKPQIQPVDLLGSFSDPRFRCSRPVPGFRQQIPGAFVQNVPGTGMLATGQLPLPAGSQLHRGPLPGISGPNRGIQAPVYLIPGQAGAQAFTYASTPLNTRPVQYSRPVLAAPSALNQPYPAYLPAQQPHFVPHVPAVVANSQSQPLPTSALNTRPPQVHQPLPGYGVQGVQTYEPGFQSNYHTMTARAAASGNNVGPSAVIPNSASSMQPEMTSYGALPACGIPVSSYFSSSAASSVCPTAVGTSSNALLSNGSHFKPCLPLSCSASGTNGPLQLSRDGLVGQGFSDVSGKPLSPDEILLIEDAMRDELVLSELLKRSGMEKSGVGCELPAFQHLDLKTDGSEGSLSDWSLVDYPSPTGRSPTGHHLSGVGIDSGSLTTDELFRTSLMLFSSDSDRSNTSASSGLGDGFASQLPQESVAAWSNAADFSSSSGLNANNSNSAGVSNLTKAGNLMVLCSIKQSMGDVHAGLLCCNQAILLYRQVVQHMENCSASPADIEPVRDKLNAAVKQSRCLYDAIQAHYAISRARNAQKSENSPSFRPKTSNAEDLIQLDDSNPTVRQQMLKEKVDQLYGVPSRTGAFRVRKLAPNPTADVLRLQQPGSSQAGSPAPVSFTPVNR